MNQIQLLSLSTDDLKRLVTEAIQPQLEEIKKNLQPIEPTEYLSRNQLADMLQIDLSTLHNWNKKGIIQPHQLGGRIFYLRHEIKDAIIPLKK